MRNQTAHLLCCNWEVVQLQFNLHRAGCWRGELWEGPILVPRSVIWLCMILGCRALYRRTTMWRAWRAAGAILAAKAPRLGKEIPHLPLAHFYFFYSLWPCLTLNAGTEYGADRGSVLVKITPAGRWRSEPSLYAANSSTGQPHPWKLIGFIEELLQILYSTVLVNQPKCVLKLCKS